MLEGQRTLRAEMAVALAEKEFQLQQLSERGGSELLSQQQESARALAETLEAEKEKRIAHTQQMAAMRMGKQQLSKGWQTWLDGWLEQQRHKRMLAAAAGRLMKPALAAALTHWRADWQEELRAALEEGQRILHEEQARRDALHVGELEKLKEEMMAKQAKLDDERKWQQEQRVAVTSAAKVAAADVETEYQRKMAEQVANPNTTLTLTLTLALVLARWARWRSDPWTSARERSRCPRAPRAW